MEQQVCRLSLGSCELVGQCQPHFVLAFGELTSLVSIDVLGASTVRSAVIFAMFFDSKIPKLIYSALNKEEIKISKYKIIKFCPIQCISTTK